MKRQRARSGRSQGGSQAASPASFDSGQPGRGGPTSAALKRVRFSPPREDLHTTGASDLLPQDQLQQQYSGTRSSRIMEVAPGAASSSGVHRPLAVADNDAVGPRAGGPPSLETSGGGGATDDKYDRQVRLWGDEGQRNLRNAHVLALGSSAVFSESVKNLVLPGVRRVTIVDDALVEDRDLGENFFLSENDRGCSRAVAVAKCLQGLNEDCEVRGVYVESLLVDVIEPAMEVGGEAGDGAGGGFALRTSQEFFDKVDLVLAPHYLFAPVEVVGGGGPGPLEGEGVFTDEKEAAGGGVENCQTPLLCRICDALGVPLIKILSAGFLGYLRVYHGGGAHVVRDAKPEPTAALPHQLRLKSPFPGLQTLVKQQFGEADRAGKDIPEPKPLDSFQHAHLPWPLILVRAKQLWDQNNPSLKSPDEKRRFKEFIKGTMRRSADEVNFQEAIDHAYLLAGEPQLPHDAMVGLKALAGGAGGGGGLPAPGNDGGGTGTEGRSRPPREQTNDPVAAAVLNFVEKTGSLPIPGDLPDATTDTESYVAMQGVFQDQAAADVDLILRDYWSAEQEKGAVVLDTGLEDSRLGTGGASGIDLEKVRSKIAALCKGVFSLRVVNYRSWAEEADRSLALDALDEIMQMAAFDPDELANSMVPWYFAIRSVAEGVSLEELGVQRTTSSVVKKAEGDRAGSAVSSLADAGPGSGSGIMDVDDLEVQSLQGSGAESGASSGAERGSSKPPEIDWDKMLQEVRRFVVEDPGMISVQEAVGGAPAGGSFSGRGGGAGPVDVDMGGSPSAAVKTPEAEVDFFPEFMEIATTSSLMGGIVGQEAVKLVTGQYVPVANTVVYNGILAKSETIEA